MNKRATFGFDPVRQMIQMTVLTQLGGTRFNPEDLKVMNESWQPFCWPRNGDESGENQREIGTSPNHHPWVN